MLFSQNSGQSRAQPAAPRSSFARSRKAASMSTRAWRPPANGMWPPVRRSSLPRAAALRPRKACPWTLAAPPRIFASRPLSPGEMPAGLRRPAAEPAYCPKITAPGSGRRAICVRRCRRCGPDRRGKKRASARCRRDKAVARRRPRSRDALNGLAAAYGDRVIAAELRRIDLGVLLKGATVALIIEPPDGPLQVQFELSPPKERLAFGEIGHWIEAADGEPGCRVDRQLVVRGRPRGRKGRRKGCQNTRPQ